MTDNQKWETFLNELRAIDSGAYAPPPPPLKGDEDQEKSSPTGTQETENDISSAERSYINKLLGTKLVETKESDIELLRSDPSNPLHSVKSFKELSIDAPLLKGISAMGFYNPSKIQEKALPYLIGENCCNMIAQSQSGTGKTATFLLAMLSRVDVSLSKCQCLCMAPTRELAVQIANVGRQMAQFIEGLHIGLAVRDETPDVDADNYVKSHILIGTPGTVAAWMRGTGRFRIDRTALKMFVLDEADIMMEEDGFLHISRRIVNHLPPNCQLLLFSATYDEDVLDFAHSIIPNPVEFRVRRNQLTLTNIKQFYILSPSSDVRYARLAEIYGSFHVGQAIIFCATRREAKWLERRMTADGHKVKMLSGDLDVHERETVISQFRSADFRVLITTNLCSRGLDVPQVNLVINWRLPLNRQGAVDCETYLHRIGRSGRFGKGGLAINFAGPEDEPLLQQLENHFDITIPLLTEEALSEL
uniref:RNA helicase n=2 Tax=Schistocephalus solidus TaxID=70667 RepID=A0A0X3Q3L5_SCHSO